jgi:hypothetical protein
MYATDIPVRKYKSLHFQHYAELMLQILGTPYMQMFQVLGHFELILGTLKL